MPSASPVQPSSGDGPATSGRKIAPELVPLVVIAGVEALALAAYAVAIFIASFNSYGATDSASRIEALLYLVFAALVGLVAWGLIRRRGIARTPFLVVQVFGLVVAYPLLRSGSAVPVVVGVVIAAISVAGLGLALRPGVSQALSD